MKKFVLLAVLLMAQSCQMLAMNGYPSTQLCPNGKDLRTRTFNGSRSKSKKHGQLVKKQLSREIPVKPITSSMIDSVNKKATNK